MDWHNADEDKPEGWEPVLACYGDDFLMNHICEKYVFIAYWDRDDEEWMIDHDWFCHEESGITHWAYMELP